ncbi:MAG: hypothetical protein KBG15_19820 [Kofleriaceae bacterium]|nr:hypothetical protein [Kofleriaceae bacterium]
MADLAQIVAAARAVQVDDAHAVQYVQQLRLHVANASAVVPSRSWLPWAFALATSTAAVVFAVLWLRSPSAAPPLGVAQPVSSHLALTARRPAQPASPLPPAPASAPVVLRLAGAAVVVQPGAQVYVVANTATTSTLHFTQGVASFRGGAGHLVRVQLSDGELLLRAGIASIATDANGSAIRLEDGGATFTDTVGRVRPLPVGQQARFAASSELAVTQLRALTFDLPLQQTATTQAIVPTANQGSATADSAVVEQWRLVRLLRGQGKFAGAAELAHKIGVLGDATWSPIALLEAARIELGPLLSSTQAIKTCDELLQKYPQHALAREAADIRCRALTELGRSSECQVVAP